MYKNFIKATLMCIFTVICFGQVNSYAHKKFESKSEIIVENKSLEDKFENDFDNYQSFENSVKPINQFINLFGLGGFSDQRLKDSSFNLWDTYEKEMSKQIGIQKLNGPDINNTFNESLNSLGK
tara:strand:- start:136 stop:507 length:372 start_codon:yes stop_codon:yes gene_type:complete